MRAIYSAACLLVLVAASCGETASPAALPHDVSSSWAADGESVDLEGHSVNPFPKRAEPTVVWLFVRCDCPISNRYAPEIKRLSDDFAAQGIPLWLVYCDPDEDAETVRKHQAEYSLAGKVILDHKQDLAKLAAISVTPEAVVAVYTAPGQWSAVYRGRIDNLFVDFGRERPQATRSDLRLAVSAALAQKKVEQPMTTAIGCPLPPLRLGRGAAQRDG